MTPEKIARALAAEIRAESAAKQIGIAELAKRAGISKPSAYRYLSGERDLPVPVLLELARVLGTSVADLFDRAHERARRDSQGVSDAD